jgi:chromosome partitioning protein
MAIIVVGSSKGGSGKSTIATNLAALHRSAGNECILIDTDPQQSASNWCAVRAELNLEPAVVATQNTGRSIATPILDISKRYKDVIIDAPGHNSPELRGALVVADLLLYPLRPSSFDAWVMAQDIVQLIEEVRMINPRLAVLVVMNALSTNPASARTQKASVVGLFEQLKPDGMRVSPASISHRAIFDGAIAQGRSVVEHCRHGSPSDEKGVAEMRAVYEEVLAGLAGELPDALSSAAKESAA